MTDEEKDEVMKHFVSVQTIAEATMAPRVIAKTHEGEEISFLATATALRGGMKWLLTELMKEYNKLARVKAENREIKINNILDE